MEHITVAVKHLFAAIAFVAAAFIAYWALTIICWLLSWVIVILGTLAVGALAFSYVRANGLSAVSFDVMGKARGLVDRFTVAKPAAA